MSTATATGPHAPLSTRLPMPSTAPVVTSLPPPPSPEEPAFADWIKTSHKYQVETRQIAETIADAAIRIERAIGQEPQPAQGIEGYGLLKVFSGHVKDREINERRRADIRLIVGTITLTLTLLGGAMGVYRALFPPVAPQPTPAAAPR